MKTIISSIDINNINEDEIKRQAKLLKKGKTVIFPTETVYGLGANALEEIAVKKIYEAKGRPSDNPLIVHIYKKEQVYELAKDISDKAEIIMDTFWPGPITIILNKRNIVPKATSGGLDTVAIRMPSHKIASDKAEIIMDTFWPGPITIILNKRNIVPKATSGGLDTVAIRMPSHKIAIEIIKQAGIPIAAPSANISGRPSPTKANHVYEEMNGRVSGIILGGDSNFGLESTVLDLTNDIPMILRPGSITKANHVYEEMNGRVSGIILGGDSNFGLESTVLDLTNDIPMILRPGSITKEELEKVIGEVDLDPSLDKKEDNIKAKAPGMKYTHYSPNADVYIVSGETKNISDKVNQLIKENSSKGLKSGVMCLEENKDNYTGEVISLGSSLEEVGSNLFDTLREMDKRNVDIVYSEEFSRNGVGQAIMNRLLKSAGYKVIEV